VIRNIRLTNRILPFSAGHKIHLLFRNKKEIEGGREKKRKRERERKRERRKRCGKKFEIVPIPKLDKHYFLIRSIRTKLKKI
jgi:hypothetical protein